MGDIGYLDEDGYLYLTDRKSNMIISGGEKVFPKEVEDAVASLPGVMWSWPPPEIMSGQRTSASTSASVIRSITAVISRSSMS